MLRFWKGRNGVCSTAVPWFIIRVRFSLIPRPFTERPRCEAKLECDRMTILGDTKDAGEVGTIHIVLQC